MPESDPAEDAAAFVRENYTPPPRATLPDAPLIWKANRTITRQEQDDLAGFLTPKHYQGAGGMTPFDVIDAFGLGFYDGTVVKFLLRWRQKGELDDLLKAAHYLHEAIARAEKGQRGGRHEA